RRQGRSPRPSPPRRAPARHAPAPARLTPTIRDPHGRERLAFEAGGADTRGITGAVAGGELVITKVAPGYFGRRGAVLPVRAGQAPGLAPGVAVALVAEAADDRPALAAGVAVDDPVGTVVDEEVGGAEPREQLPQVGRRLAEPHLQLPLPLVQRLDLV